MMRTCEDCHRVYDDEECWTICPHGPLDVALDQYCPVHDLVEPYQPDAFTQFGCPHKRKTSGRAPSTDPRDLEVRIKTVEIAHCPESVWHDIELRARVLNILAGIINFMLPDGYLFVLTIFGDKKEGSYVSNAERESAIAGVRELTDKLESGETWSHYTPEGHA